MFISEYIDVIKNKYCFGFTIMIMKKASVILTDATGKSLVGFVKNIRKLLIVVLCFIAY